MSLIERIRALCLALPEARELETWDHPTFRVGPGRDWDEVGELIATSYCLVAPKRLAANVTTPPALQVRRPERLD